MESHLLCSLASVIDYRLKRTIMCIINEPRTLIHFHKTTTLTPEQFVAGLTDFAPGRSKLFAYSADEYLKVHSHGPSEADVTEGSRGIWERLYYDWSDHNRVLLTTIDSNVWECGSSYTYTFTRRANGTTDIDVHVAREGKNLKGGALGFLLRTFGRRILKRGFENLVKAIEARNAAGWRTMKPNHPLPTIQRGAVHKYL